MGLHNRGFLRVLVKDLWLLGHFLQALATCDRPFVIPRMVKASASNFGGPIHDPKLLRGTVHFNLCLFPSIAEVELANGRLARNVNTIQIQCWSSEDKSNKRLAQLPGLGLQPDRGLMTDEMECFEIKA